MTVCISLTNGTEAVVMADAMRSFSTRESASARKYTVFAGDGYHSVVTGTGATTILASVLESGRDPKKNNYDTFLKNLAYDFRKRATDRWQALLEYRREEIRMRALVHLDDKTREEFLKSQYGEAQTVINKLKEDERSMLCITSYTREPTGKTNIHLAQIDGDYGLQTRPMITFPAGSGRDLAEARLLKETQGVELSSLKIDQLAFMAAYAYIEATMNVGVGGTPSLLIVDSAGVKELDARKARAITHLAGAYEARFRGAPNYPPEIAQYCGEVVRKEGEDLESLFAELAERLKLTINVLTTMPTALHQWYERRNADLRDKLA
jgi:hypothetical protein